jgi:hypothetical protein
MMFVPGVVAISALLGLWTLGGGLPRNVSGSALAKLTLLSGIGLSQNDAIEPDRVHKTQKSFFAVGGTEVFGLVSFHRKGYGHEKFSLNASLQYAANSLNKPRVPIDVQNCNCEFSMLPYPEGTTLDWQGLVGIIPDVTFESGNLNFQISGNGLDPNIEYTVTIYTGPCDCCSCFSFSILSQTLVGQPVNGQLSVPSPLENGYQSPNGGMVIDVTH